VLVISAPRVVTDGVVLSPGAVAVSDDGVVVGVAEGTAYAGTPADVRLSSGLLSPGLIDLQVNGCFGVDLVDATAEEWATVRRRLPATGVTAFLPTFITAPVPRLVEALRRTAALQPALSDGMTNFGARVLGVHVEGPFLAPRRRGAHNADWLCDPEPAAVEALLSAAPELLRVHTLAPELPGALDAIRRFADAGVLVSVGHSNATAAEVEAAADAGARLVTHLFNAQRPLHHREPGVVGQALVDQRLTCGLIADLHHVAGPVCRLAFQAAPGRIMLVTDAIAAAGMPPGRYVLGGQEVVVDPGGLPLRADGTISGSGLRLDDAVANMVAEGVDLLTALDAATRLPAGVIGRPELGRIAPGAAADLVWLSDDLRARATWVGGELAYGDVSGPVPACRLSSCANGSNSRGRAAAGIPGPLSRTAKRIVALRALSDSSSARTCTSPWSVNFTALPSRFTSTWRSHWASPRRCPAARGST
jgi:N-acetylglucosamine-6-phosphate deacetylase